MDRATVSRIEDWDARAVTGGYAGLSDLARDEFTGAVATGGTYLFMLNGRVVGVADGSISAFEGTDSTAHEAPDPALPLLFAMRERGGEVRGKYYTDDTPLREVDETLSEGGFTGYLELSENVLSGDYYVVYYGGRSLAAAFVGSRERVVTGEEAFELAADEIGIYEVHSVELEVTDVPEPPEGAAATATGTTASDDESTADDDPDPEPGPESEAERGPHTAPDKDREATDPDPDVTGEDGEPDPGADGWASVGREDPDTQPVTEAETGAEAETEGEAETETEADAGANVVDSGGVPTGDDVSDEPGGDERDEAIEARTDHEPDTAEPARVGDADAPADEPTDAADDTSTSAPASGTSGASEGPSPDEPADREAWAGRGEAARTESRSPEGESDERFREEERWREARTVPALDPEESELPAERTVPGPPDRAPTDENDSQQAGAEPPENDIAALRDRVGELEEALESTERERRRQADRVEELTEERDELLAEREALEDRIEELESRVQEREARIEEQEAQAAAGAPVPPASDGRHDAGTAAVDPQTALDQTDVFVRYGSKGEATLETAHDGRAGKEAVAENLRLETHSRFDAADATVDGRPFHEFLADTIEYRFVSWLVEDLLYELQGTGNERGLRAVYDAVPEIDRAEFGGTVASVDGDGGERQETFDVVCRDRMGKPLLVANINDSLDPATGEMMGALVEDATAAAESHESIGAAFVVTASFFEPEALETAAEATGGGFLSRDSKKSFVKLSRKGGYHLCLVEARAGDFHVAVPEL